MDPPHLALGRSPDTAKVKPKMLYASSKDAFRRLLDGKPSIYVQIIGFYGAT